MAAPRANTQQFAAMSMSETTGKDDTGAATGGAGAARWMGTPPPDAAPAGAVPLPLWTAPVAAGGGSGSIDVSTSVAAAVSAVCGIVASVAVEPPADLPSVVAAVIAATEAAWGPDWDEPFPCDMCGYMGIRGLDLVRVAGMNLCGGRDDCGEAVADALRKGWEPGVGLDWCDRAVKQGWYVWTEGGLPAAAWFTDAEWAAYTSSHSCLPRMCLEGGLMAARAGVPLWVCTGAVAKASGGKT